MNELAFQLMSLQYELAMKIGGTLDRAEMLRSVLETLIRRLDARAAAVFELVDARPMMIIASPGHWQPVTIDWHATTDQAGAGTAPSAHAEPLADGAVRYLFPLPDFGLLALERNAGRLEPQVLRALEPLMAQLGRSARACTDHATVQATQRRFSALVSTVPEMIFEARIDPDGRLAFEYVSPRARDLFGIEPQGLLATPELLLHRIEESDRTALTAVLARAAATGGAFDRRVRLDARSIEPRWILIAGRPRHGDASDGLSWSGIIQDVTARELYAESRRQRARDQFDTVLSAIDDAIIGSDATGCITHWNKGAERMLGHPAAAVLGRPLSMIVPERLRRAHARGFTRHVTTGEGRITGRPTEMHALHAAGHEVPVELMLSRSGDADHLRFFAVLRDLTTRKQAEQRLAFALEVQQAVAESSTLLLSAQLHEIDALLESTLGRLGRLTHADRVHIFRIVDGLLYNTHEWCSAGVQPQKASLQGLAADGFRYFMAPLKAGQALVIPSVEALPEEATPERLALQAQDIERLVAVPVIMEGTCRGFLGVDNPASSSAALDDLATPLRVFSEVVAGVLQRVAGERERRALHLQISGRVAEQRAMLRMSADLAATRSRHGFYGILDKHLSGALAAARLTLMTLSQGGRKVRIRPLNLANSARVLREAGWIDANRTELEVDLESLAGHPEWQALVLGRTASTERGSAASSPDPDAGDGSAHIVIVPLVGPDGVLGCFKACFSGDQPLLPQTTDWVEQIGALLGAHIAAHEAREALADLNTNLEARVASRTAAFQASEERFTTLFDRAPQAMLLLDHEGRVTRANVRARALFRIGDDAPTDLSILALIPAYDPRGGAPLQDDTDTDSDTGDAGRQGRSRLVTARRLDGTTFQAETSLVTVSQERRPIDIVGVADVTERIEAQDAIVRSLHEKETLIKEIHHRVKNNLQIISSLLMLQSDRMPADAARELLAESVLRVRSMALIHEQIYGMDSLDCVDLGGYAHTLARGLGATLAPTVRVRIDTDVTPITINEAIPLGLILNELLTNAFKYGIRDPGKPAPHRRTGEDCDVLVEITPDGDTVRMAVTDSGHGLPEGIDLAKASSLGFTLLRALVRQLRGTLAHDVDGGTRFVVSCPRSTPD